MEILSVPSHDRSILLRDPRNHVPLHTSFVRLPTDAICAVDIGDRIPGIAAANRRKEKEEEEDGLEALELISNL